MKKQNRVGWIKIGKTIIGIELGGNNNLTRLGTNRLHQRANQAHKLTIWSAFNVDHFLF
jgi:hypothetical protein